MITFLEFVCEHLMGPPLHGRSWRCPFHSPDNHPSFSVRPPKQRPDGGWHPIKFRCHACGTWGDEWDLILNFYQDEQRHQHLKRLRAFQSQYEQLTGQPAQNISYRGKRGDDGETLRFCLAELRSVVRERQKKWRREEDGLATLVWASEIAHRNGVKLDDLIRLCASELIAERRNAKHQCKKVRPASGL